MPHWPKAAREESLRVRRFNRDSKRIRALGQRNQPITVHSKDGDYILVAVTGKMKFESPFRVPDAVRKERREQNTKAKEWGRRIAKEIWEASQPAYSPNRRGI